MQNLHRGLLLYRHLQLLMNTPLQGCIDWKTTHTYAVLFPGIPWELSQVSNVTTASTAAKDGLSAIKLLMRTILLLRVPSQIRLLDYSL